MAPPRPALAQSESKARFFERLGLDERNEFHRRVYAMMKEEAVEGRRRMTESQDVLVPSLRGNTNVEPPYSNAQISETVTHREILRIYRLARPETRVVYDLGRDTDRVEEENWQQQHQPPTDKVTIGIPFATSGASDDDIYSPLTIPFSVTHTSSAPNISQRR
ncbi:hypothetical protein CBER1_08548 [Cercospora berteroae]|uniref:Uncharacterized protein n=1 Tax=Cercospora berteroae TaxID=357750 RepID=A0A2S6BUJ9_9PEZI|nr:hypothetical protein CBER1_08548 [Cercospora berteroae]